ncbi:MAG: FAD-binding oxidoreductase [Pseudomonadota bacterium]
MISAVDIAIIGGGIAGASLAAHIAPDASVALLEREDHAGYHASGRSAAAAIGSYGNDTVKTLSAESIDFYNNPPDGFAQAPIFIQRSLLMIAGPGNIDALEGFKAQSPALESVSVERAVELAPILSPDFVQGAAVEQGCGDLDVDVLLQAYLSRARQHGASVNLGSEVLSLHRNEGAWDLRTTTGPLRAKTVVNAAGAWADQIASVAGATPLALSPLRRTALTLDIGDWEGLEHWPLVIEATESFYFRPDAGKLLVSGANEDPSVPCDAQPEELDIAIAMDRFHKATTLDVRRVEHSWAGLRTFAPDRSPVAGWDPRCPGFFWYAGQGGYGVQMAEGLARLGCDILLEKDTPRRRKLGQAVSPSRLSETASMQARDYDAAE